MSGIAGNLKPTKLRVLEHVSRSSVSKVDEEGFLHLFDWKRSKGLAGKFNNSFRRMREPLSHIDDCQGQHYRLQLNIYKWILETYYDQRVKSMAIVCTHPDCGRSPNTYLPCH